MSPRVRWFKSPVINVGVSSHAQLVLPQSTPADPHDRLDRGGGAFLVSRDATFGGPGAGKPCGFGSHADAGGKRQRVESLITEKLEEKIREVKEVRRTNSSSRAGMSYIVVELYENVTAVDEVWSRVRNKIDDARPDLPAEASEPEFDMPDFKAYALIVSLTWELDGKPNYAILRRNAERLEEILRSVPGTEKTELYGDPEEEIVVEVRPSELDALGLTAGSLAEQLGSSDAKTAAGQFRGDARQSVVGGRQRIGLGGPHRPYADSLRRGRSHRAVG